MFDLLKVKLQIHDLDQENFKQSHDDIIFI